MNVVFRVDASVQIGSGHVMRCITLADKLHMQGADIHFICREFQGHMLPTIRERGYRCTLLPSPESPIERQKSDPRHTEWLGVSWLDDVNDTIRVIEGGTVDWLIVDHYGIDDRWHEALRPHTDRLMVIDDLADRNSDCDVLLDQTYGRSPEEYSDFIQPGTELLLGSKYALLRPEFFQNREQAFVRRKAAEKIGRILVFMGGMDSNNITALVVKALNEIDWEDPPVVDVVLNGAAPHLEEIKKISSVCEMTVTVHSDVKDMAELMLGADLAIGGGGSASWERCCLGLPAITIGMASNQRQVLRALSDIGALVDVGTFDSVTQASLSEAILGLAGNKELMGKVSNTAFGICDGLGIGRVLLGMFPVYAHDGGKVTVRDVTIDDAHLLFEWQNLPETRRYANNTDKPEFSGHLSWLQEKISNPSSYIWMIEHEGEPSGVIRLDGRHGVGDDDGLLISIYIAPSKFRLGIASCALRIAQRVFSGNLLIAEILPQNDASLALFNKAGFVREQEDIFVWKSD